MLAETNKPGLKAHSRTADRHTSGGAGDWPAIARDHPNRPALVAIPNGPETDPVVRGH
mgnify:CR=1 FL=1